MSTVSSQCPPISVALDTVLINVYADEMKKCPLCPLFLYIFLFIDNNRV